MDADNLHRRLKKIIGQIQAIDRMVDEDVPCEDILMQINAAKSALHKVGQIILEGHLNHCVREGIEHGDVDKTIEDFAKAIQELDTKKYEPLVSVNEKGEKVRILVNIEKDYIRELVILGCENTECYLVHLTGKIKPDDIQTVVNDNDK